MWEKHTTRNLIIIGVTLLIGGMFFFDWRNFPQPALQGGLDINGGFSLIFEIDDSGVPAGQNVAEEMKRLLQRRVDPQGVLNTVWRVHGDNRIEIQMPLPPPQATELRERYQTLQEELFATNLSRSDLNAALAQPEPQRSAALDVLAARSEATSKVLGSAAEKYDLYQAALQELRSYRTTLGASQPTDDPRLSELELAYRNADEALEDAIADALESNLDERRFVEMLEMDAGSKIRASSLDELRARHAKVAPKIDAVLAAHAAWSANRGYLDGPADLRRLIRGAGVLEFRILAERSADNPTQFDRYRDELAQQGPRLASDEQFQWFRIDNPVAFLGLDSPAALARFEPRTDAGRMVVEKHNDEWFVLAQRGVDYEMLGDASRSWSLTRAGTSRDQAGRPCVTFEFDPRGGDLFRTLTGRNVQRQLCIFVDGIAYSAANINEAIGKQGQITGEFSPEKVSYLVNTMQAGALPARLKDTPLSERTIGSSLGQENLARALRAGLLGAAVVLLFMVFVYLVSGLIANAALAFNVFLMLAALSMLGARMTLDGIAGVILSIGMAVDANILIFERMREEQQRGSNLRLIIKNGFDKALSTILDSNITTLLTCVIIYYVGSEEIRGFGLTLGWGIVLNIFTSIFVSRTLFAVLIRYNLIKTLKMQRVIGVPNIDWIGMGRTFVPVSVTLILGGLALVYLRGADALDVEFRGGVSADVEIRAASGINDVEIGRRLQSIGQSISADAQKLASAAVSPAPGDAAALDVSAEGVSAERLVALLSEPLEEASVPDAESSTGDRPLIVRGGVRAEGGSSARVRVTDGTTAEQLKQAIARAAQQGARDGNDLSKANVSAVTEIGQAAGRFWNVTTTVANKLLVQEALKSAIGADLVTRPRISYTLAGEPAPILERRIESIPGVPVGASGDVSDFVNGAAMIFTELSPPRSAGQLRDRLRDMRLQPGYQDFPYRKSEVFGLTPADVDGDGQPDKNEDGEAVYASALVAVADELYSPADLENWRAGFANQELALARAALETEQSLRKVSQFKPQIAGQSRTQAILALLLSWGMIIGYMWMRFGQARYGVTAVTALVHDVLMSLAFLGVAGFIGRTVLSHVLLIEDFKIDMTIVAAFLTIIGFSINDTIVIFDRIRESKGRLGDVTAEVINRAVNQTLSRTVLTSTTVMFVLLAMYVLGGAEIRGFNYCMIIGVLTGTYSSVAIAAPMLLVMGQRSVQRQRGRLARA